MIKSRLSLWFGVFAGLLVVTGIIAGAGLLLF